MIDDLKHLTRRKQVNYHRLGIGNMSRIFGVKLWEICLTDFLNVLRFGVPADSCLLGFDALLLGEWFLTF
jgi:hypothetical protein